MQTPDPPTIEELLADIACPKDRERTARQWGQIPKELDEPDDESTS